MPTMRGSQRMRLRGDHLKFPAKPAPAGVVWQPGQVAADVMLYPTSKSMCPIKMTIYVTHILRNLRRCEALH